MRNCQLFKMLLSKEFIKKRGLTRIEPGLQYGGARRKDRRGAREVFAATACREVAAPCAERVTLILPYCRSGLNRGSLQHLGHLCQRD